MTFNKSDSVLQETLKRSYVLAPAKDFQGLNVVLYWLVTVGSKL